MANECVMVRAVGFREITLKKWRRLMFVRATLSNDIVCSPSPLPIGSHKNEANRE